MNRKRRLKKCLFCKRKESRGLIGSANEGLCSWCNRKHPVQVLVVDYGGRKNDKM
jgi:hypothetical protein